MLLRAEPVLFFAAELEELADFFAAELEELAVFLAAELEELAVFFAADDDFFAAEDVFFAADEVFFAADEPAFLAAVVLRFAWFDAERVPELLLDFFAGLLRAVLLELLRALVERFAAPADADADRLVLLADRFAVPALLDAAPASSSAPPASCAAARLATAVARAAAPCAPRTASNVASAICLAKVGFASSRAPLTTSLKAWPGRNFGTAVLPTFTVWPVAGLRAVRAARSTFSKTPKPLIATRSPAATARVMASTTASTALLAAFLSPR